MDVCVLIYKSSKSKTRERRVGVGPVKLFRSRIPCKVNESGQKNRLRQQAVSLHCNEQGEICLADWFAGRETHKGNEEEEGEEDRKSLFQWSGSDLLVRNKAMKEFNRVDICCTVAASFKHIPLLGTCLGRLWLLRHLLYVDKLGLVCLRSAPSALQVYYSVIIT